MTSLTASSDDDNVMPEIEDLNGKTFDNLWINLMIIKSERYFPSKVSNSSL